MPMLPLFRVTRAGVCRAAMCMVSAFALASCSAFDQKWANTPPPMTTNPAAIMAGKWEGTWQSDANAYHGHLQSIITFTGTSVEDKDVVQQYQAEFHLRMFDISPAQDYTVTLKAEKLPDGRIHFVGTKDLGYYLGGIFFYDGYIYPERDLFYCDYNSDKDTGTFKMRRITQDKQ
jgi:hypothetical protein